MIDIIGLIVGTIILGSVFMDKATNEAHSENNKKHADIKNQPFYYDSKGKLRRTSNNHELTKIKEFEKNKYGKIDFDTQRIFLIDDKTKEIFLDFDDYMIQKEFENNFDFVKNNGFELVPRNGFPNEMEMFNDLYFGKRKKGRYKFSNAIFDTTVNKWRVLLSVQDSNYKYLLIPENGHIDRELPYVYSGTGYENKNIIYGRRINIEKFNQIQDYLKLHRLPLIGYFNFDDESIYNCIGLNNRYREEFLYERKN